MAEHSFQEVIREFQRMCKTIRSTHGSCEKCPIKIATYGTMFMCYRYIEEYPENAESIIMRWAAENPEPVYPTWWEYMCMIGVIPDELGDKTLGEMTVYSLMNTYIQSDLAQKLGIDPKEG